MYISAKILKYAILKAQVFYNIVRTFNIFMVFLAKYPDYIQNMQAGKYSYIIHNSPTLVKKT